MNNLEIDEDLIEYSEKGYPKDKIKESRKWRENKRRGSMKSKIGVMGYGSVGKSVVNGFKLYADIKVYDPKYNINSFEETLNESDFVFICVQTPMGEDGNIDLTVLNKVMEDIDRVNNKDNIIIIKSTIIPGTTQRYNSKYPKLNIIHNPEYITERLHLVDFVLQPRIVLGGCSDSVKKVSKLYQERFPGIDIYISDSVSVELAKYAHNAFFAMKVSFMNVIYSMAKRINSNVCFEKALFQSF